MSTLCRQKTSTKKYRRLLLLLDDGRADKRRRGRLRRRLSLSFSCLVLLWIFASASTAVCCSLAFTTTFEQKHQHQAEVPRRCSRRRHYVSSTAAGTTTTWLTRQCCPHTSSSSPSSSCTALFMAAARRTKQNTPDDEAEWRALLAAFQMYKAAYGDLKVPSRFIVPGMAPWPESAWGMKLGQKVAAIRSTGRFVQNNEGRRKILDDLGFQWRIRAAGTATAGVSFDQIYDALATYKAETGGSTTVPPNFVVPDCDPWPDSTRGLPLGKTAAQVRSKSYLKNHPGAKEKLEALGFQLDGKAAANDTRFQKVYDALVTYKKLNGDLLVPQPFVVPEQSEQWPESTWGLRLGARVNAIRSQGTFVNTNPDRRKQLDDIGFVWSPPPSTTRRRRGRRTNEQIEAQRAIDEAKMSEQVDRGKATTASSAMENLFGPSFAFEETTYDSTNDGKEEVAPTWEVDGSVETSTARAARAAEEATKPPQDDYEPPTNLNDTLEQAKQKAIDVGVITVDDDGKIHKGKREKYIPWFNDDFGQDFVFEDVVEALTVYKSLYGNFSGLIENDEFVVPAPGDGSSQPDDGDDEDNSFDLDAPERVAAAIAKEKENEDLIAAEIRRLREGTAPQATMVAETEVATQTKISSEEWPEHLAGMVLGNIVRRIRDGSLEVKHLPERKAQLDELDFDWGDPKYFIDVPFEKAMCAMYAYYLVRGDMFVYEDFCMPDEDPWPRALACYEVGRAVRRIRELQNSFEAYHPEKVTLLRAIDFVWFPSVALPLDPNEPEMSAEMIMVGGLGHPDYYRMRDIPLGLPDKIVEEGPVFESDDVKQWWREWHNWDYVKDYWHDRGRRDNAYWLRKNGFPTLADEHEEKYGPGFFHQFKELMKELNEGVEEKCKEEKDEYMKRLNYFRDELVGCTDVVPWQLDKFLAEIDTALLELATDGKLENVTEETLMELEAMEDAAKEYDAIAEEEVDLSTSEPADYGATPEGELDDYENDDPMDEFDDDYEDIVDELDLDYGDDGEIDIEAAEDDLIELEDEEEDDDDEFV